LVEVAVGIGTEKRFLYRVPPHLEPRVKAGRRVLVPLGGRLVVGCAVGFFTAPPPFSPPCLREVEEVLDDRPSLDGHLLQLTREIARVSLSPWGEVIAAALPPLAGRRVRWVYRLAPGLLSPPSRLSTLERKIWDALQLSSPSPLSLERLQRRLGVKDLHPALYRLRQNGWILRQMEPVRARGTRRPKRKDPCWIGVDSARGERRKEEGEGVDLAPLLRCLRDPSFQVFLLFGGSRWQRRGCLRRLIGAVRGEEGVLLLVPEIESARSWKEDLESWMEGRVCLLHSGLSAREREEEWSKVQEGGGHLVIGTRSAVFAPHPRLGTIIIDDEHHPSFKQEEAPRYHAREVALIRCRLLGIPLVMASATPSLESFYRAERGEYHLLSLEGAGGDLATSIVVVDMAGEARRQARSGFISAELKEGIEKRLLRGERAALFVPRRGSFGHVFCKDCGFSFRCHRCDYPLVLHRAERKFLCHHCGWGAEIADRCPACRGMMVRYSSPGTQEVEEEMRRLFPEVEVRRLDRDTQMGRAGNGRRGDGVQDGGRILVGTQMILTPSILSGVSLIGVLQADALLNLPDFRAGERLFSLVMELRNEEGAFSVPPDSSSRREIILQTYNPDHYVFQALRSQDYLALYHREMSTRRELLLPPYVRLANLEVRSRSLEKAKRAACALCSLLSSQEGTFGPPEADASPLPRLRGEFRWRVMVRGAEDKLPQNLAQALERFRGLGASSGVSVRVDLDPIRLC